MATTTATLAAERWLDEVMLNCVLPADVGGAAVSESIRLPSGLGDVAILSVRVRVANVLTAPVAAGSVPRGVSIAIVSADGSTVVDFVGERPFVLAFDTATALEFHAVVDPDALVLWRQGELMTVIAPEMDSNAAPTGDVIVVIKAVRVRPTEQVGQALQLVR